MIKDTKFLTDLIAVYKAGIDEGERRQCAYEWGLLPTNNYYENLASVIVELYPEYSLIEIEKYINEISK